MARPQIQYRIGIVAEKFRALLYVHYFEFRKIRGKEARNGRRERPALRRIGAIDIGEAGGKKIRKGNQPRNVPDVVDEFGLGGEIVELRFVEFFVDNVVLGHPVGPEEFERRHTGPIGKKIRIHVTQKPDEERGEEEVRPFVRQPRILRNRFQH